MKPLRHLWCVPLVALCVLLAACNLGGGGIGGPNGGGPTPIPPTPTPNPALASTATGAVVLGKTQNYSLGSFQAYAVAASANGLVVAGSPNAIGNTVLAYGTFGQGSVATIAKATTAPDGQTRGITRFVAAGDWAVYEQETAVGTEWELWAVQLSTGKAQAVDSATAEKGSGLLPTAFATDGTDVAWAVPVAGQTTTLLQAFDLAKGATRTLLTSPQNITNVLLTGGLLFWRTEATTDGQLASTAWLWWLTQPQPIQLKVAVAGSLSLNNHYLAWDDANTTSLTLYDLTTGQMTTQWVKGCTIPLLAPDRPYVVCNDDADDIYRVVRTPAGTTTSFGSKARGGLGNLANGRVYWVPEPNVDSNNVVAAFDLPTT